MKFLSYLPHPLIIGVLALLMMYLAAVPMIAMARSCARSCMSAALRNALRRK